MPRIRTIKPEFWDSPSTARASAVARLTFIGMWNWADDFGRGTANIKELEGFIFPNDDIEELSGGKSRKFRDVVAEVEDCFGVLFYTVAGRPYYAIETWESHQRNEKRAKSKYPGPDEADSAPTKGSSPQKRNVRHTAAELPRISGTGTGEQGNRGTEEQGNRGAVVTLSDADAPDPDDEFSFIEEAMPIDDVDPSPGYPADFNAFWDVYPRRGGKGAACTAFLKAKKRAPATAIISGAHRLKHDPNLPADKTLVPMPATWLNQDRWEDDPLPARGGQPQFMTAGERKLDAGKNLVAKFAALEGSGQQMLEG